LPEVHGGFLLLLPGAWQQIADYHASAAALVDEYIAAFHFCLHCLAASVRRTFAHANGLAEFARCDHNACRALRGGAAQLRDQLVPE
jgi:hypothetical protein